MPLAHDSSGLWIPRQDCCFGSRRAGGGDTLQLFPLITYAPISQEFVGVEVRPFDDKTYILTSPSTDNFIVYNVTSAELGTLSEGITYRAALPDGFMRLVSAEKTNLHVKTYINGCDFVIPVKNARLYVDLTAHALYDVRGHPVVYDPATHGALALDGVVWIGSSSAMTPVRVRNAVEDESFYGRFMASQRLSFQNIRNKGNILTVRVYPSPACGQQSSYYVMRSKNVGNSFDFYFIREDGQLRKEPSWFPLASWVKGDQLGYDSTVVNKAMTDFYDGRDKRLRFDEVSFMSDQLRLWSGDLCVDLLTQKLYVNDIDPMETAYSDQKYGNYVMKGVFWVDREIMRATPVLLRDVMSETFRDHAKKTLLFAFA